MFVSPHRRRLTAAALATAAWIVLGAASAFAKVGPDDPGSAITPSSPVPVSATDWSQLAMMSAAACLIGVAATLAVQLAVRRSHRRSVVHA
jgi:hypothetical protein